MSMLHRSSGLFGCDRMTFDELERLSGHEVISADW